MFNPVHKGLGALLALDNALRLALTAHYPELANIHLTDFKVRVLNVKEGTAAQVRTVVDSADAGEVWSTVGVSKNIIDASWHAVVDGIEYGLLRKKMSV